MAYKENLLVGTSIVPPGIQLAVANREITSSSFMVYVIMRGAWGGYPKIFVKQQTIADRCGLKIDATKKCLAQLKKTGWVLFERQHISHGNNRYWICDEPFKKRENDND